MEMTIPLFQKVDCLSIPVPDLEAALAFYSGDLGHELIWRSSNAAGLKLPGSNAELVVNEHEVVPPWEPTHGWLSVEARMGSGAIIVLHPAREDTAAIRRGVVRPPVRPLTQRRLDEPLRFAVRAGRVGAGPAMNYP